MCYMQDFCRHKSPIFLLKQQRRVQLLIMPVMQGKIVFVLCLGGSASKVSLHILSSFSNSKRHQPEEIMQCTSKTGPVLQLSEEDFSFKTDCFFCKWSAKLGRKRKHDVLQVKTIGIKETVLKICQKQTDSWSDTVKAHMCMACMLLMHSFIRLAESIFAQRSRCSSLQDAKAWMSLE